MTVKEIVKQWLEEHGYDGLAGQDCGCICEGWAFMDCSGESCEDCEPAYKCAPTDEDKAEYGDDVEYVMRTEKDNMRRGVE